MMSNHSSPLRKPAYFIQRLGRHRWLLVVVPFFIYFALLLPAVSRQGISWDEQTDIEIARAYLAQPDGWLVGSPSDPSQTRLPHFTVAILYAVLQRNDLITARLVSVWVGFLTLAGVFWFCWKRLSHAAAFWACILLAASPFFLSFARVAFTETDIYLACCLTWLMIAIADFQDQPSQRRMVLVGLVFGLALSAKFTAVAVLPAVLFGIIRPLRGRQSAVVQLGKAAPMLIASIGAWAAVVGGVIAAARILNGPGAASSRWILFGILGIGWLLTVAWAWRPRPVFVAPWLAVFFVTGLGMWTFLVLPPEHLTNPGILHSLWQRFTHEASPYPGFIFEASGLHILSIVFKSGPVIGGGYLFAWLLAVLQFRRAELQILLLASLGYFGCLCILPIAQTFYTVPILPFLAIFLADQAVRAFTRWRLPVIGLGVIAAAALVVDLVWSYPDFNLNGYQWLGAKIVAGRSTIGYRSVVQTPSDGVEQAFVWLNAHARPGDRVRAYVLEWHIIHAVAPQPDYTITNGLASASGPVPDYVVTEMNTMVPQSWWTRDYGKTVFRPLYDEDWLEQHYNKVFTVPRAFGIEMAAVWQKKLD